MVGCLQSSVRMPSIFRWNSLPIGLSKFAYSASQPLHRPTYDFFALGRAAIDSARK
jgi:hypothetical protein